MNYKRSFVMFFLAMTLFHLASNYAHPVIHSTKQPAVLESIGRLLY